MLIFHLRFPKRRTAFFALSLIAVLGLVFALSGCLKSEPVQPTTAATNEERIAYLNSFGWEVAADPVEILDLQLPEDLRADYRSYIKLQNEQGLPFTDYGGRQVKRFTYAVSNYPDIENGVQANLYLCDDLIIGGDIICTGAGGFQSGLTFPES